MFLRIVLLSLQVTVRLFTVVWAWTCKNFKKTEVLKICGNLMASIIALRSSWIVQICLGFFSFYLFGFAKFSISYVKNKIIKLAFHVFWFLFFYLLIIWLSFSFCLRLIWYYKRYYIDIINEILNNFSMSLRDCFYQKWNRIKNGMGQYTRC